MVSKLHHFLLEEALDKELLDVVDKLLADGASDGVLELSWHDWDPSALSGGGAEADLGADIEFLKTLLEVLHDERDIAGDKLVADLLVVAKLGASELAPLDDLFFNTGGNHESLDVLDEPGADVAGAGTLNILLHLDNRSRNRDTRRQCHQKEHHFEIVR